MKIILILVLISVISFIPLSSSSVNALEHSPKIPEWIKGVADWWVQGIILDEEFLEAIEFLVNNGMIEINAKKYC